MRITLRQLKAMGVEVEVIGGDPEAKEPRGRPEGELVDKIIQYSGLRGWVRVHFRPARLGTDGQWRTAYQGDDGFPDVIMGRDKRLVVIEAKAGKNKPTKDQNRWLDMFRCVGAETYIWYPEDWDIIEKTLE